MSRRFDFVSKGLHPLANCVKLFERLSVRRKAAREQFDCEILFSLPRLCRIGDPACRDNCKVGKDGGEVLEKQRRRLLHQFLFVGIAELVWKHLKADTVSITSLDDFRSKVKLSMLSLQRNPEKLRSFFHKPSLKYAA
jgi:hypothetical protein